MPVEGGNSARITDYFSFVLALSPTNENIALTFFDDKTTPVRARTGIISASGGPPTTVFDFPTSFGTLGGGFYGQTISFTRDGKSLSYIDTRNGVSNIWSQPIAGGPSKQLTHFTSDMIFYYAWSSDGKKLAMARGTKTSDVVLIKDLRNQNQ